MIDGWLYADLPQSPRVHSDMLIFQMSSCCDGFSCDAVDERMPPRSREFCYLPNAAVGKVINSYVLDCSQAQSGVTFFLIYEHFIPPQQFISAL